MRWCLLVQFCGFFSIGIVQEVNGYIYHEEHSFVLLVVPYNLSTCVFYSRITYTNQEWCLYPTITNSGIVIIQVVYSDQIILGYLSSQ